MNDKGSFILFTESWNGLSFLDDHQLSSVIRALFNMHGANCPMPELDTMSQMALGFILPRIEENRKKYEAKLEQKRINGSKGGRPPKPKNPEVSLASTCTQAPITETEQNQEKPKKPIAFLGFEKNHGSDPDSDPDYVNTTYSNTPLPPKGEPDAIAPAGTEFGNEEAHAAVFVLEQPALSPEETQSESLEPVQPVLSPEQPSKPKRKRTDYRRKDFEDWATKYGANIDDETLWKAWKKQILKIPEQAVLMAALDRYQQSKRWQDGYMKDPENYLRQCYWTKEFPPAQPQFQRKRFDPDSYTREDFANLPENPDGSVDLKKLGVF